MLMPLSQLYLNNRHQEIKLLPYVTSTIRWKHMYADWKQWVKYKINTGKYWFRLYSTGYQEKSESFSHENTVQNMGTKIYVRVY